MAELLRSQPSPPSNKGLSEDGWKALVDAAPSTVFGIYRKEEEEKIRMIGLARIVSDEGRMTWLADFVVPDQEGQIDLERLLFKALDDSGKGKGRSSGELYLVNARARPSGLEELMTDEKVGFQPFPKGFPEETRVMYRLIDDGEKVPELEEGAYYPGSTGAKYFISTDEKLFDMDVIHGFLKTAYWSPGVERETLEVEVKHSSCIGLYHEDENKVTKQIGFARWVTDGYTVAYLTDVFVLEEHRNQGLGTWLIAKSQEMDVIRRRLPLDSPPSSSSTPPYLPKLILFFTSTPDFYKRDARLRELDDDSEVLKLLTRFAKEE